MITPQRIDKILADSQLSRDAKVQAVRGVVLAAANALRVICAIPHDATPGRIYGATDARESNEMLDGMISALVDGVRALEFAHGTPVA